MYLAHHLITVDKMFTRHKYTSANKVVPLSVDSSRELTDSSKASDVHDGLMSASDDTRLRDLVSSVRRLGNDYFTRHINSKKRQLCEMLSSAKGARLFYSNTLNVWAVYREGASPSFCSPDLLINCYECHSNTQSLMFASQQSMQAMDYLGLLGLTVSHHPCYLGAFVTNAV